MILIDNPYVSDLLKDTIKQNRYKVVGTKAAKELAPNLENYFMDDAEARKNFQEKKILYANSENAIEWIKKQLADTDLPAQIDVFKNKGLFRDMLKKMYPDFAYKKIKIGELADFDPKDFGFPFILKPAIGFFSMGIYVIETPEDWQQALKNLDVELEQIKGLYPEEVMNNQSFLLEQYIEGQEFAVDAYFDKNSRPVILNIYEHIFTGTKDVSDRAYFTSKKVIEKTYDSFEKILEYIGQSTGIKQFPMHIEFRITPENQAIPIEANPLRFAGWCMADMAYYAWGINPYTCFLEQQKPDLRKICQAKEGKQYNVIIANTPKNTDLKEIKTVDYEKFTGDFSNLLQIHKTNYKKYPVFAFAFSETSEMEKEEINHFLHSSLEEYVVLK